MRTVKMSSYNVIKEKDLNVFDSISRIVIAGRSNSGKSFFTAKLINKYYDCFSVIILIGGELPGLNREKLILKKYDYNILNDDSLSGNKLIVYDDTILEKQALENAARVFLRGRHKSVSVIFITQNLFFQDKFYRSIFLNATYFVLFKIRDLNQLRMFAGKIISKEKIASFIEAYKKFVIGTKFNHLLVDLNCDDEDPLMFRTYILSQNLQMCISL